jgi:hypothetical protein
MEDKLIDSGIKNLKEFGYPAVTKENILTDMVYSQFFLQMLEEQAEAAKSSPAVLKACDSLIAKIKGNPNA